MAVSGRDMEQGHRQLPQAAAGEPEGYRARSGFFISECIQKTILVIQLLSLPFEYPDVLNLPHGDDFFEGLTFFRLHWNQWVFVTLFLVFCGTTVLFGVFAFLSQIEDCGMESCLSEVLSDEQWVYINDILLYGVLFVPMIKMCLEMFNCTDGSLHMASEVECWEGLHVVLFVLSILCLITMAINGTVLAIHRNRVDHYPGHPGRMRKSVQHFETKVLLCRLVVTFFTVYTPSVLFTSIVGLVVYAMPFLLMLKAMPFIEARYNVLRGTEFSIVCWGFFVGVVGGSDGSRDTGSMAFWLFVFGVPALVVLGTLFWWRLAVSRPPTAVDFLNPGQDSNQASLSEKEAEKHNKPKETVHAGRYRSAEDLSYELGAQLNVRSDLTVLQLDGEDNFSAAGFGNTLNNLVAVLENNQQLQRFCLSGLPLKNMEAVQNLAQSLLHHQSVRVVEFFNCQISEQMAFFLQDKLKDNKNITQLNLGENGHIFAEAREIMLQRRKNDPSCQHLRIMF